MDQEEVVCRLEKLLRYIVANSHKARTPEHREQVILDAKALEAAIFICKGE
jgi:hypothetical protein